jgi:hypothetical protein
MTDVVPHKQESSAVVFANNPRWKNKECLANRKSGVPGGYEGSEFLTQ